MTATRTREQFRKRFGAGAGARVFRAPGRVNLIGEHVDYNDGLVMPAGIGLSCWVAARGRRDRRLVVHSDTYDETCEADFAAAPPRPASHWSDYPFGIAVALERAGMRVASADLLVSSDVPLGAGLASSAALEVAVASALLSLAGHTMDGAQLAQLCQRAEHEFVGVNCGIMDQFAALHAAAGHALLLDCRSLEFSLVPLPADVRLVVCHTMVKHQHAAGEYNQRRADCEEAVRLLSAHLPGVRALRDVSPAQLTEHQRHLPERLYRRARHVVTEIARTQEAAAALRHGDLALLGRCMAESHASLRDDYEVSCRELDLMVEIACRRRGVHGSRMTGGGFGGCTVSVVNAIHAEEFREHVAAEYAQATGVQPLISILDAAAAAEEVGAN